MEKKKKNMNVLISSVAVPDPNVLGPPGSGSFITRYGSSSGSRSFYHQTKIVKKL
jgi:hypothetical protein